MSAQPAPALDAHLRYESRYGAVYAVFRRADGAYLGFVQQCADGWYAPTLPGGAPGPHATRAEAAVSRWPAPAEDVAA